LESQSKNHFNAKRKLRKLRTPNRCRNSFQSPPLSSAPANPQQLYYSHDPSQPKLTKMLHKRALNDFCGLFAFCSKQQKHFVWGYYNGVRADHFSGGSSMWDGIGWEQCGVRFVEDVWIVWRPCVFVVYLRNQPRKTPKRQPNMRLCSGKLRKYRKECEEHGCTYRSMLISLPMLRCSSAFRNFVENL